MSGPRTPFTLWLQTAEPGDQFVVLGMTDIHVVTYAKRYGCKFTTERAVIVSGSHSAPSVMAVIVTTMVSRNPERTA